MNVASLPLCKELYKLSGWERADLWVVDQDSNEGAYRYDLGYLIRKAGSGAGVVKNSNSYTARRPNMYGAPENKDPLNGRIGWDAETPEDAMCVMLIELIKKGLMDVDAS